MTMAYNNIYNNNKKKKGQELTLLVKDIRYTHGKISRRFRIENRGDLDNPPDGPLLEETFEKLAKDPTGIMIFPKILVMEQNDDYWAVNGNRRLFVYKMLDSFGLLGIFDNKITVWHVPFDSERFNQAFTNKFEGKCIQIHGIPNMQQYDTKLQQIYLKNKQIGLQSELINRNKNKLQTQEVKELPVKDIRYTHQMISRRFRINNRGDLENAPDGPLLEETFEKLVKDPSNILSFPKIPVMECDGHFWAVNGNRRLFVYKMLDSFGLLEVYNGKITVSHVPFDAEWFIKSFSSHCEGKSVHVHGIQDMQEYEMQFNAIYMQNRWNTPEYQPVKKSTNRKTHTETGEVSTIQNYPTRASRYETRTPPHQSPHSVITITNEPDRNMITGNTQHHSTPEYQPVKKSTNRKTHTETGEVSTIQSYPTRASRYETRTPPHQSPHSVITITNEPDRNMITGNTQHHSTQQRTRSAVDKSCCPCCIL